MGVNLFQAETRGLSCPTHTDMVDYHNWGNLTLY